jgi:hypothetical protein
MAIRDFQVGQLRELIKFEQNTPSTKGSGFSDNYTELLNTRGRLRKKKGDRGLTFGQITLDSGYELIVRAEVALNTALSDNPAASLRVVADNRLFTITSFEKVEQKGFFYIFLLNETQL